MIKEATIYFDDPTVTITNTRANFGSLTYAISDITFVSMAEIPPNGGMAIIGFAFMAVGLVGGASIASFFSESVFYFIAAFFTLLFVGIGICFIGVPKNKYVLKIWTDSCVSDVLTSTNRKYIKNLVRAVNNAMIEQGSDSR